jgi:hypothetical protein
MTLPRTPSLGAQSACLGIILFVGACATAPPTRTGFIEDPATLTRVEGTVRAQADTRSDPAKLSQIATITIVPTIVAQGVTLPDSLDASAVQQVLSELDRQMCFELSKRFTIASEDQASQATKISAAITGLQVTNPTASVASAAISRLIPGPGSVRLPVGRGGLSIEARAMLPGEAGEAGAMAWSRGSGVLMDKGSLSEVGDAHRYTREFAETFAKFLVADADKSTQAQTPDPCARFRTEGDLGRRALGTVLGLHVPNSAAPPKAEPPKP